MIARVYLHTYKPAKCIVRETISRELVHTVDLPDDECKECRPDWGQYSPVVTFPAVERALKRRGYLGYLNSPDQEWCYEIN